MGNDEPRDALTAKLKRGRRGSLLESLSSILEKTSRRPRVIGVAICSFSPSFPQYPIPASRRRIPPIPCL